MDSYTSPIGLFSIVLVPSYMYSCLCVLGFLFSFFCRIHRIIVFSQFVLWCIVFAYSGRWGGEEQRGWSSRRRTRRWVEERPATGRSCHDVLRCKGGVGCRWQQKEQAGVEGKQHRKIKKDMTLCIVSWMGFGCPHESSSVPAPLQPRQRGQSLVMSTGSSHGYLRHDMEYLVELAMEVCPSML